MLYLGGDTWIHKDLIKTAPGNLVPAAGKAQTIPNTPRVNNGITGEAWVARRTR